MSGIATQKQILDAAERIIIRDGVKQLTIENVAVAAGISRGGVLYHFKSKDDLVKGMLTRLTDRFESILNSEVANDPEPHGRWTRAFARATLRLDEETASVFAPLMAAIVYNPAMLEASMENQWARWQARMEDEFDPVTGAIVRLASYALWLNDIFSMNNFNAEQKKAIVDRLVEFTRIPETH